MIRKGIAGLMLLLATTSGCNNPDTKSRCPTASTETKIEIVYNKTNRLYNDDERRFYLHACLVGVDKVNYAWIEETDGNERNMMGTHTTVGTFYGPSAQKLYNRATQNFERRFSIRGVHR